MCTCLCFVAKSEYRAPSIRRPASIKALSLQALLRMIQHLGGPAQCVEHCLEGVVYGHAPTAVQTQGILNDQNWCQT